MDSASSAAIFLAAIAVSDGLRLLPAGGGAIVVSRPGLGEWKVTLAGADAHASARLRLVTWCSPVVMPLVLLEAEPRLPLRRALTRFHARARRAARWIAALRVGGLLALIALVIGIPYLTARFGAWGLLIGLTVVFLLSSIQAVLAFLALRRVGMNRMEASLSAARFCWPFSAPRAAEEVMRQVASDVPPLVVVSQLLPPRSFASYARPMLYDAIVRGVESDAVRILRDSLGAAQAASVLRALPDPFDGAAYCPRCGACYTDGTSDCSDCSGIALVPQPAR